MKNLFLMLLTAFALCSCAEKSTFTLWQLPSQADDHGNSYVIRTANGHIIAMDGGKAPEADYLRGFLAGLGNKVDAWIVTHPHGDHIDAMMELMEQRQGLTIGKIYHSRYTDNLIDGEPGSAENTRKFYSMLDGATDFEVVDCALGQEWEIDGVHFKVLAIRNPEIMANTYNNSSMVIRVWDDHKSVVFLGDLGAEAGDKLLASEYAEDLNCDYLQLAHHGQRGCSEQFYKSIKFRACLWPTATWLYNNDRGEGFNTAQFESVTTRRWMEEIGITEHYVSCDGLHKIE